MAQKTQQQVKHVDNVNVNEARTRSRDAIQSLYAQAQDIVRLGAGDLDKKLMVQAQEHFTEWQSETNLMSSFFGGVVVFVASMCLLFIPFTKHLTEKMFLVGFFVVGISFFRFHFSKTSSPFAYVSWGLLDSVKEQIFIDGLKYEIFKGSKFYKFNFKKLGVMVFIGSVFLVASVLIQFNFLGLAHSVNWKIFAVIGAVIFTFISLFRWDEE